MGGDDDLRSAIRLIAENLAEPAGAAGVAARPLWRSARGQRIGLVLTGAGRWNECGARIGWGAS
jgi:hypothetical protein